MSRPGLHFPALLCATLPILALACGSNTPAAPASAAGSWTGTLSSAGTTAVGIRFILQEDNGKLTGQTYVEDPTTHDFLPDAELTGSRQGSDATWSTSTDLIVRGKFAGNDFVGTLEFPADDPLAIHLVDLVLMR